MTHPLRAIAVLILLVLACCAGGRREQVATAQAGLQTAMSAAEAAARGFEEWDRAHQGAIVAAATSEADGRAKLATYRQKREAVLLAFEAFEATVDAALAIMAVTEPSPAALAEAAARSLRAVLAVRNAIATLESTP